MSDPLYTAVMTGMIDKLKELEQHLAILHKEKENLELQVLRQANTIATYQQEFITNSKKLLDGTLHCLICNGDHRSRVGTEGKMCNCTLGQEIKQLRKRAIRAEELLKGSV